MSDWLEEEFYFGNAVYPSSAIWRSRDGVYQFRVEREVSDLRAARAVAAETGMLDPETSQVGDHLFVHGYFEYEDQDVAKRQYERDKQDGWGNIDGTYPLTGPKGAPLVL